jgi:pimeloyl-ACP methyl ester carboxylesterase
MQTIIIAHGALGSNSQMQPLIDNLSNHFKVVPFEFPYHGNQQPNGYQFSMEDFSSALLNFVLDNQLQGSLFFGYSMGGYAALFNLIQHKNLFSKVITLGTKFDWTPDYATKEASRLNPEFLAAKVPKFVDALSQRHAHISWQEMLQKTSDLMLSLGNHPLLSALHYAAIETPILLIVGDRDATTSIAETQQRLNEFINAQLLVLPKTPHPIEKLDIELITLHIRKFANL